MDDKEKVIIVVREGCASVEVCPEGLDITIIDFDEGSNACPACDAEIGDQEQCPYCGEVLEYITCPECGEDMAKGQTCGWCGYDNKEASNGN